jgi:putative PIG3 family NAD(P)H quinone oxidoreductase
VLLVKAVVVASPGDPEQLRVEDVADPVPAPGEVLIRTVATAVNRADTRQRQGFYPPPEGASPYLGLECSGVVAALGDGVDDWAVGDRVCALLGGGGYAEQVAVPAAHVLPVPDELDLVSAAALPEAACTVWSNLFGVVALRAGDTLLVHGGSSGIGTFAIQLARAWGARVACTASSAEKLARCADLGADILIDYRTQDFVDVIARETGGRGVDVILDLIGAPYLSRNVEALAVGGRLSLIGLQGGTDARVDIGPVLRKRLLITGSTLRSRPLEEKARIVADVREHVWPLVRRGVVRPVVDRVLPLDAAGEAHRIVEASSHVGKIVLRTGVVGTPVSTTPDGGTAEP